MAAHRATATCRDSPKRSLTRWIRSGKSAEPLLLRAKVDRAQVNPLLMTERAYVVGHVLSCYNGFS